MLSPEMENLFTIVARYICYFILTIGVIFYPIVSSIEESENEEAQKVEKLRRRNLRRIKLELLDNLNKIVKEKFTSDQVKN